jgi:predicted nucleic acid-binding protein
MNGTKIFEMSMDNAIDKASRLAPTFKMNTADLLHIAICKSLKMKKIMTFDTDDLRVSWTQREYMLNMDLPTNNNNKIEPT